MDAQDLSLFIGQEVQTPYGVSKLLNVTENGVSARNDTGNTYEYKYVELKEIKPICRRMEDMTSEEAGESQNLFFPPSRSSHKELASFISLGKDWEYIKWLTSKGICPFDSWIESGAVIIKEK